MATVPKSKYGMKRASGRQMYGPGCCAHAITPAQIETAKREADKRRRIEQFDAIVSRASRANDSLSLNFAELA